MKLPLLSLLLLSTWAGALYGETIQGAVVGISDGDTITVLDSKKHSSRSA